MPRARPLAPLWAAAGAALIGTAAQAQETRRVEITGSSLKALEVESAAPVSVLRADDLARAGVTTAEQALRRISANQSAQGQSQAVGEITGGITEADLRGLGAEKTLVLLNGRRLANHAYDGGTVDLNALPMSAIDRIEVLREGASAIYGSGAVGGVVNFILRRDVAGIEASVEAEAPERAGGDMHRATLTAGLTEPGRFSAFATLDHRQQRAVDGRERPFSRSGVIRRADGSLVQFVTGPASFPGDLDGFEPSLAAGCAPPRSIPDTEAASCRYDFVPDIDLLPRNEQTTLFGQALLVLAPEHTARVEWLRAENRLLARQSPTAASMRLPDSSPYWIDGRPTATFDDGVRGGIVNWLIAPAGRRANASRSIAERGLVALEGVVGALDYQAGWSRSTSTARDALRAGYLSAERVQQGLLDGRINPFGAQTAEGAAALRAAELQGRLVQARGEVDTLDARIGTQLLALPGGALELSFGAETRRERFDYAPEPIAAESAAPGLEFAVDTRGARSASALFAQLQVPVSPSLKASLAARQDRYSDSGRVFSPKLALRWQPRREWLVRGSLERGFRAPTLYEIHLPQQLATSAEEYDDPVLCPDGEAVPGAAPGVVCGQPVLVRFGGPAGYGQPASRVRPETSKGMNLGLVIEPVERLAFSVDVWDIRLRNEIDQLSEQAIFEQPAKHAARIVRCSQLDAARLAAIGACLGYPGFDAIALVDTPIENLGNVKTRGIDVSLSLTSGPSELGELSFEIQGTHVLRYAFQSERGGPYTRNVGRFADDIPIFRWQHSAQVAWTRGPWNTTLSQRYKSGYADQEPGNRVGSYASYDLFVSYGGIRNLSLTAGVKNLFDRQPPYSNQDETLQRNHDPRFADPLGRALSLRAAYKFF